MEEPSIQVDETTETATPQSETNAAETAQVEEAENIDYKAELERYKKRVEQAEYTARRLNQENKRLKQPKEEEPDDDRVRKLIREEVEQSEKRLVAQKANELIRTYAATDDEAKLIEHHYQNSIVPTGNLEEDIENAKLLANKRKYTQELAEMRRSLVSKQAVSPGGAPGQRLPEKRPVEITNEEKKFAAQWGMTPEEVAKAKE